MATLTTPTVTTRCPQCGNPVLGPWSPCPTCGDALSTAATRRNRVIPFVVAAVLIAAIAGAAVFALRNTDAVDFPVPQHTAVPTTAPQAP